MATTQERKEFREIMGNVVNIIQGNIQIAQAEGRHEEFKGILSIADYIARYYMANYYNSTEHEYVTMKKEQHLVIELASYIAKNWTKFAPKTDNDTKSNIIVRTLEQIDNDLYEWKRNIYYDWINGKLDKEFRNYIQNNIETLTGMRKMRYIFVKEFRYFDRSRTTEIRKALGLIGKQKEGKDDE